MFKRWTSEEDESIDAQLKRGIKITKVKIPGRNKPDIRKRALRAGLIKKGPTPSEKHDIHWAAIEEALGRGGRTMKQLASETGMTLDVVRKLIKTRRAEVHIAGQVIQSGRPNTNIWALGPGEDVVAHDPVTDAVRDDPEAAMIAEARARLREVEARGELIRRDPFVAALFGKYTPSCRPSA
ncbi:hypothetical protein QYH69_34015 [Paraburkholderia sp. SARCC-3016]|uniref:hypothetical protein n=1 Tax=Paraburkholderia sp. SARCC-3016 TaxID=3058611 RepID=UPI002808E4CE|nr:hypothetical protein [Paraburkholderia sp. SARCC-3016]MDQ7982242.1 hypothetical protein [Paraburkholderia sp. SARCC-3016]